MLLLTMMLNTWNMRQFNKFKTLMTNEKTFLHKCSRKKKNILLKQYIKITFHGQSQFQINVVY